jgi:hypothetical protein
VEDPAKKRGESDSKVIDRWIVGLDDWRGRTFKRLRELIKQADPGIEEELKWKRPANPMGSPVYSHSGIVCTGAVLKNSVRLTFLRGASLDDPSGQFNFGLDSNVRRAIDVHEGDKINEAALKGLIRSAVALNVKIRKQSE